MKKILLVLAAVGLFCGCSSVQMQNKCPDNLQLPSYFAQGEILAGFAFSAQAHGYGTDGILQITRSGNTYEVLAFSVEGYQLFRAELSGGETTYTFISQAINYRSVRKKINRFLSLLLTPPQELSRCQTKKEGVVLTYRYPGKIRYEYGLGQHYPGVAIWKKTFSSARLYYGQYQAYNEAQLPYMLHYQEGNAQLRLRLLTLKK